MGIKELTGQQMPGRQ